MDAHELASLQDCERASEFSRLGLVTVAAQYGGRKTASSFLRLRDLHPGMDC